MNAGPLLFVTKLAMQALWCLSVYVPLEGCEDSNCSARLTPGSCIALTAACDFILSWTFYYSMSNAPVV